MTQPRRLLLDSSIAAIRPVEESALSRAEARQAELLKPPGALGQLETLGNTLASIYGACPPPDPSPAMICVFAGDHGVQRHGVSPWPSEVTVQMLRSILAGGAAVSVLAKHAGVALRVYDMGTLTALPDEKDLRDRRIAPGTADMTAGPALTSDQCLQAVTVGIEAAAEAVAEGHRCLLAGEVGIGNTTPAAALVALFTGQPATEVTGPGAGAHGEGLERKRRIVEQAIRVNGATADDPLAALAAVGGLEHAAITGFLLGAATHRVPVILDGLIVCSAALVAAALAPAARGYFVAGHNGAEPGVRAALDTLGLTPVLDLGLRLGEGTGALTAFPVVRSAAAVLREMGTFADFNVSGKDSAACDA